MNSLSQDHVHGSNSSPNFLPIKSNLDNGGPCVCATAQPRPYKVILVGDSGVGKSSIMTRFCDGAFSESINPSIGIDFRTKVMSVNGAEETIQIWDTAGAERFRSLTQSYFRRVDGVVLVYDITLEQSFLNLQHWITCVQGSGQHSGPMTIIGNKLDLEHLRCVSKEMAVELAAFYEADYVEVSAKDGCNIDQFEYDLVSKLVEQRALSPGQSEAGVSLPDTPPTSNNYSGSPCCVIM